MLHKPNWSTLVLFSGTLALACLSWRVGRTTAAPPSGSTPAPNVATAAFDVTSETGAPVNVGPLRIDADCEDASCALTITNTSATRVTRRLALSVRDQTVNPIARMEAPALTVREQQIVVELDPGQACTRTISELPAWPGISAPAPAFRGFPITQVRELGILESGGPDGTIRFVRVQA